MAKYHYLDGNGEPQGPFALEDIRALFTDGLLHRKSKVRKGGGDWKEARLIPELEAKARANEVYMPNVPAVKESGNPPAFVALVVLTLILWPVGLIGGIVYLCEPKTRGAGAALLAIALASAVLSWVILRALGVIA